jgi:hypothetical protein
MGRKSSATTCPVIPFPRPGGPPRSDLPCAELPGVSPRHRRRRLPRARPRPRAMRPPARCIAPFCLFCEARVPSPCVFLVMPCFFDYLPLCVPCFAARCEIGHFACSRSFSASWSRTCHVTFFTTAQAPKRSRQKEKKKGRVPRRRARTRASRGHHCLLWHYDFGPAHAPRVAEDWCCA